MSKIAKAATDATQVFDEDIGIIPPDITVLSHGELRAAHSYWVGNHNYSSSQLARIQQKLKERKRQREIMFKILFIANKQDRQSNEMARYNAELNPRVMSIDDIIEKLEEHQIRWNSLVEQCDQFRSLLSREQSWREKERDVYYQKGGVGR